MIELIQIDGVEHEAVYEDPLVLARACDDGSVHDGHNVIWEGPESIEPTPGGRYCTRIWLV